MSWEKLDDGNTDEFTFDFVTEELIDRLDDIIGFNTEGWFEHNHRLRNKIKPKNLYQDKYRKDESSLFNLVHKILYFPDNHDPYTGERIDEDREWNCLYEYFLSPKQYEDVCEEKFPSYWVTDYRYDEDEMKLIKDPNYRKMNDFLIRIYEEVFQHVEQHEIMDHYGIQ